MFPFFQQLALHLLVDHVSRAIDKKEEQKKKAASSLPVSPAVAGLEIGSARRARMRRAAAVRDQLLGELLDEG